MAVVSGMPPILRLKRSAQSGAKGMAAAYGVVYTENTVSSALAYIFSGAEIDLSPMAAGDIIDIRVRKVIVPGGAWVNHNELNYIGPVAAGHPAVHIGPIPDVYGVEISMRQTAVAVALLSIDCEFYDAKRLGLV